MRSRIFCVLLGLAMGWTVGCATTRVSYAPKEVQSERLPRTIPTPGRQIGLLTRGSICPTVPGWRTESLFELAVAHAEDGVRRSCDPYGAPPKRTLIDRERQAKADYLFRKHGLNRFCFYTREPQGQEFQAPAGLSKVGPDQLALTPNAPTDLDSLGDQIWEPLAEHFLDQVGTVQLGSAQNSVRLVFVDTHPTGEGLPVKSAALKSLHGYGMAHLGDELVCGHDTSPQSCPVHIATRLALRHDGYNLNLSDDPGSDDGGHQGRIGDLAIAILAEIEHWQTTQPEAKLILNLSIGWDSEYNDPDATRRQELDAATQSVYDALEYAHDLGVLVIAAAGNRSGGQNSQWPLLPAAWELRSPSWSGVFGKKVVYAVGGVDWQGLPLPNARPAGMPSRVAYADHAVAKTSGGTGGVEPTKIYTGSSVSAVVASSIAAVVWHLRPSLTPDQVMERMDVAAKDLPSTATFYTSSWFYGPPHLKGLSLCKTVLSLCEDGGPCPAADSIYCPQEYLPADFSGIIPHDASPVFFNSVVSTPSCDPQTLVYKKSGPTVSDPSSCPMELLPDMNTPSLVQTLPPETPCPTCSIAPGFSANQVASLDSLPEGLPGDSIGDAKAYSLAAALDPDWLSLASDTTIESAILVIDCKTDASIKERLDLTQQFSSLLNSARTATAPLQPLRLSFGPIGQRTSLKGCTASVDFRLKVLVNGAETERSVQSAVYVDP